MTSATTYAHLTGTYTIDGTHSRIGFVARHAMVTKVRGSFNEFEGSFTLDGENPANSSANVTIQTKSVDTRNADRDGHLRNNDFLSVDEFPTITFTSTGIAQTGEDTFDVTGDLTVKGITKSVTIPFEFGGSAKDPFGNDRVGFEGKTSINRSDYGVTFNAALETGGVLVSDKITLEFEISAIKNA
ncbi:polyisoprenoid-binding protein [Amycolatopsis sp. AA4]|uniref:YceI family protein n=1 Tax=Actinomycetes TaxID=1760 RepID=UPI0001B539CD|nr:MULTISPECIES: YceI family protein [Actinomycetes]ATY09942.1 polyisoprenoid-binding protein [Amycolatopsis sp. AA4]EFL05361.1 YceI family protein [Streptomyces sp. AA4]